MNKVLILSSVWCEPKSSAAGLHMYQIIESFHSQNWQIFLGASSNKTGNEADLTHFNVIEKQITINDSQIDRWLIDLNPDLVIFDRFLMEEQLGWKIRELIPKAFTLLNTEDLHSLRACREINPQTDVAYWKNQEITKRELAAIYRCDAVFMVSDFEITWLMQHAHINPNKLIYLPIYYNKIDPITPFNNRNHFYFIGNFMHKPNVDCIKWIKTHLWKQIKTAIPDAELHVYGAYANGKAKALNDPKNGFIIKGYLTDKQALANYKLCLAPVQFGAGIKGKLLEAMSMGTPSVTTSTGAEGITDANQWPGVCNNNPSDLLNNLVEIYRNETQWTVAQNLGFDVIKQRFNSQHLQAFHKQLHQLLPLKNSDLVGEILKTEQLNSKKYFAKWIEAKNS